MRTVETDDEISIRHVPIGNWILSGILSVLSFIPSVWIIYSLATIKGRLFTNNVNDFFGLPEFAGCILTAYVNLWFIYTIFKPFRAVTLNQKMQYFDIVNRGFFGENRKRFHFYQIQNFKSYKKSKKDRAKYFLAVVLKNKKTLKLPIPIGDKQETVRLIKKFNSILRMENETT
jgi:hypothetical protein